jgi:hypothetical protein
MPSDEEVTTRWGSLQAMTGFTEEAFQALLPPFAQALVADMHGPDHGWATAHRAPLQHR